MAGQPQALVGTLPGFGFGACARLHVALKVTGCPLHRTTDAEVSGCIQVGRPYRVGCRRDLHAVDEELAHRAVPSRGDVMIIAVPEVDATRRLQVLAPPHIFEAGVAYHDECVGAQAVEAVRVPVGPAASDVIRPILLVRREPAGAQHTREGADARWAWGWVTHE